MSSHTRHQAIAAVLLVAFGLRTWHAHSRPLWYDEAFAVLFAEKGLGAMLYGTLAPAGGAASDVHPLVYYTALNGWMRLAGESPLAVRLPSVLSGTLTIAAVYDMSRRLAGRPAALATALAACLSPFHVYYSQETRMYAPMALWCVLAAWCLVRIQLNNFRVRYVLGLAAAAALAMYTQSLAAFFLLAVGLAALARPRLFVRVAAAGVGALAIYIPWLLQIPGQIAKLRQAYWLPAPTLLSLIQTTVIFHAGEELPEAARPWLAPALAVSLAMSALAVYSALRPAAARRAEARRMVLPLTLAAAPPALMFVVSLYQPVYLHRALLPSALMYYVVLGWALARAIPRPLAAVLTVAATVVALGGLSAHYSFRQFPRPDFPAVTSYLSLSIEPGDRIVHGNKLTFLPVLYYNRDLPQSFVGDPPGSATDTLAAPTQQVLGVEAKPDVATAIGGAARVWYVIFDRAIAEYRALGQPTHPDLAWLEDHFRAAGVQHFGDVSVYEFESP